MLWFLFVLQRVMKLVSWMACWRRCSRALLSEGREDLGKQVLTLTAADQHKTWWSFSFRSHLKLKFPLRFCFRQTRLRHTQHLRLICLFPPYFTVSVVVSTLGGRFVYLRQLCCVPQRLQGLLSLWWWGSGAQLRWHQTLASDAGTAERGWQEWVWAVKYSVWQLIKGFGK